MEGIYARETTEFDTAEKNPVNFAILTTKANEAVSYIHDRMPVILPLGSEKSWLPPNPTGMFMFPRIPAELLTSYPVITQDEPRVLQRARSHRPTRTGHHVRESGSAPPHSQGTEAKPVGARRRKFN
jgi:putative SOS response-associated peptidase YedK